MPYTDYELYVTAIGSLATKNSNAVTVKTNQDIPSAPPSGVFGSANSPTEIAIYWSAPSADSQNGVITAYVILTNSTSNSDQGWTTTELVLSSSSTFYTITNLTAYKEYSISVAAVTVIGRGPLSAPISILTPESTPSAPPLLSLVSNTATSITLSLKPPADSDTINGVISYYLVTYSGVSIDTTTRSTRILPPTADYMSVVSGALTALQEGVSYTISGVMYTVVGGGPKSGPLTVTTDEIAPTATPQNILFAVIQTTSFSLTWDSPPPLEQNGAIVGYRLAYKGVVMDTQWVNKTLTTDSTTITNLHVGAEYLIHICALNSAGEGPCISLTRRTLELLPTGAPTLFEVENRASTYLSFSWSSPPILLQNGLLLGYTLEAIGQQYSTEVSRANVSVTTFFYQLTDLEENYKYTVLIRAWNSIGYGPSAELNVSTIESLPEGSPSNLTATATTTSITIKWKALPTDQQNGQLTNYEVTYFTQAAFLQHTHVDTNVSATELQLTVYGLEEDVVYHFRVRVYTASGPGPYSIELSVRTNQALPSNTPSNLQLTVQSSTQIQIQWGQVPPIDQNGAITGYDVSVSISSSQPTVYSTTQTSYILVSLRPYTEYSVQVRANNSIGPGNFTSAMSATTKQAFPSGSPTQLSLLSISHSSVNFSWNPIPLSSLNGEFVGYSVRVTETQAGTSFLHTSSSPHSFISNLSPYTNYSLEVATVNSQGTGPYSVALLFTTSQSSPAKGPVILAVTHISSSSVLLQWEHIPTHLQNGPVVSYTLRITANSGALLVISLSLSALTNSTTITDLLPYTEYTMQLTAINTAGTSPPTIKVFITREDTPTGPPTQLTATPSTTNIILRWMPPLASEQNGVIIMYSIRFDSITYNTSLRQHTFQDLQEVTEHEFSVAAWTSIGRGPFSALISVTTLSAVPSAPPQNVTGTAQSYQSILVKWYPVPAIHQNGEITSYIVYYQGQEHDISERKLTISVTNTQVALTTLKPDEVYSIFIEALNSQGASPPSPLINIKTLEGLPTAAPTNLVITATSPFSFTIAWMGIEQQHHNGLLLHYEIVYEGSDFDTSTQRITVDSGNASAAVTNLHPANEYTVFVVALNNIGNGPNSNTVTVLLPEFVPSAAPTIEDSTPGSDTIQVVWGPIDAADRNGVIIQYEICYTDNLDNATESEQTYINVSAPGLKVTLTGLLGDTYYQIRIRAYTSAGPGPFSMGYSVETAPHICTLCINGKCTLKNGEDICICNPGYTGETCDSEIDECADITCVHGSCKDEVNNYICECETEFKGQLCDLSASTPACGEETYMNLLWPDTAYGETAVVPCSESDPLLFGDASRVCTSAGAWSPPDVSQCKKSIYVGLDPSGDMGSENDLTPITIVVAINDLQEFICNEANIPDSGPTFFPSEIVIVVSTIEDLISAVNEQNASVRAELIPQLMPGIMCILSGILDSRNLEMFSLSNGSSNAILINRLLEEVAKLNAANYDTTNTDPILFSEENIHIYISPLTAGQAAALPDYTLSAVMATGLYPDSVVIPESEVSYLFSIANGETPVIAVVFSRYLGQAIGTQSLNSDLDSTISTGVISVQNNLGESLTFSSPISLTFSLLTSTEPSSEYICMYWDSSQGWTTPGLSLSGQEATSVSCHSTHATSFTVLRTSSETAANSGIGFTTYISAGVGVGVLCLLLAIIFILLCVCLCLIRRRKRKVRLETLHAQYSDPFLQQDGSIVNPLYGSNSNPPPAKDDSLKKGLYQPTQAKQENPYCYSSKKSDLEETEHFIAQETVWNTDLYSSINYGSGIQVDDPYSEINYDPSMNPFSEMSGQDYEVLKTPSTTILNPFMSTRPESTIDTTNVSAEFSDLANPVYEPADLNYSSPPQYVALEPESSEADT